MTKLTQQFFNALSICVGEQPVKRRLASAWVTHLDGINSQELPQVVRREFHKLRAAMYTELPRPGEHAADASVRKMSARSAAYHSRTIVSIYGLLSMIDQYQSDGQPGDIVLHIEGPVSNETDPTLN